MAAEILEVGARSEFLLSEEDLNKMNWSSVSKDGHRFETILSGTSTMDFNRCGNIRLDSTLEYFVTSRHLALLNPGFCMMDFHEAGYIYFLLQVNYKMTHDYYTHAKIQNVYFAKKMIVEIHYIGNSTLSLLSILQDPTTGQELARSYAKIVRVNFETRKSAPLPKGFLEKYGKYCKNEDFEMLRDVAPPTTAFSNSYLIRYSDTDQLLHMNHASYVNLCLDAATEASFSGGFLQDFTGDICERLVKGMQCSYVRECRVGETVTITVWQDETKVDTLIFRVTKADGSLSMLCVMEFYSTASALRSFL